MALPPACLQTHPLVQAGSAHPLLVPFLCLFTPLGNSTTLVISPVFYTSPSRHPFPQSVNESLISKNGILYFPSHPGSTKESSTQQWPLSAALYPSSYSHNSSGTVLVKVTTKLV